MTSTATPGPAAPLLRAERLVKTFPGVRALDGASLTLKPAPCTPCWARTARASRR